jgi:hypothetical protein
MQWKTTRNSCWQPKPVWLVSETGQNDLQGLSLSQAGKPVRPVWQTGQASFVQEIPKRPSKPNQPQTPEVPLNL